MIKVTYNSEGIKVNVGTVSKYNKNLPLKLKIKKHVSGELQWSTNLNDNWFGSFPNTEMFDVEICDSNDRIVYTKVWDVMEHGNHFYKSLWMYNKSILSSGRFPKGLVIGTHDGEFGEWVPIVENRECSVVLVEASDNQRSTKRPSISITDLIINECDGYIDWLHLDVEGLDAQLIMGIDESKVSLPNFIIFEDYNLSQDKKNEIYSWLHTKGYNTYSEGGICEAVKG
jgi:hypothetical protein